MPPGRAFLLGTDRIFRDELVRLAYGARLSLFIALSATLLATLVGAVVGILAGYFGGTTDFVLMRVVDVGLAFPFLLLVMAIGAALGKTTPETILLVLGLTGWLGTSRIIRSKTIQLRHAHFFQRCDSGYCSDGGKSLGLQFGKIRHFIFTSKFRWLRVA